MASTNLDPKSLVGLRIETWACEKECTAPERVAGGQSSKFTAERP